MTEIVIRNSSVEDFEGINILMNQVHKLHMNNRPDIYRENDKPLLKQEFLNIVNDENTISILPKPIML